MKVLGIYGSPRKGGNTDILLDEALKGAASVGSEISVIRCCDLKIEGCLECGGCDATGKCIVDDDMQSVYPKLLESQIIILSSPIFFYGITSQAKALIDRCQALWCRRTLEKTPEERKTLDRGRGYLVSVGATKGKNLFEGAQLTAKYFFDALGMSYEGGVLIKAVEGKGDVLSRPECMKQAFDLGRDSVTKNESLPGSSENSTALKKELAAVFGDGKKEHIQRGEKMPKALLVYATRTGQSQNIADLIAEGIRITGADAKVVNANIIAKEEDLAGYDAYVFGSATYHGDMMQPMKTMLFLAAKSGLEGKVGGSFGAFGWSGEAPDRIYDTMLNIFKMDMVGGPLRLKSASLQGGLQMAQDYGREIGKKITGK